MASPTESPSKSIREVYNEIGIKYETAFRDVAIQQRSLQWLMDKLPPSSTCNPLKVLEIGSGTGKPIAAALARAGHDVLGIDVSEEMVRIAQAAVPEATFEEVDVRQWEPPQGQRYDAVVAFFSLLLGFTQAEISATIARVNGWLKPGGLFVYATLVLDNENVVVEWMGHRSMGSCLSREGTCEAVRVAGFVILEDHTNVFKVKAVEAGVVESAEDEWEEEHLVIYAQKQ